MIQTLADALTERGYDILTPVQLAVTDPALQDADLLVSAQTGSGKTVGFGLAIAPTLMGADAMLPPADAPLALAIAPTRELALQVMRELAWLYAGAGARVVSCVGGMDMRDERRALDRGAHIVVGTPGRLRDHIQRGSLRMDALRAVVLDEADEMLDLGFREDLEFMLDAAPATRRTLMFSATVPPQIAKLAERFQRDAVRVNTATGGRQHADIAYQALRVAERDAETAIVNVLRYHDAENAIVFANTRVMVARLTARFSNRGFAVVSLSGELSQTERTHALQAMRDGRARVCVATDVAARGIDLPNLDLVIHAELPSNAEGLLHRSGRTGRAGRKGISALIVTPRIAKKAERLLKTARVEAEWTVPPAADDILRRDEDRLLADPAWSDEVTPEQADFAQRLLAAQSPEAIAAAYLRLYRSRQSAPEDLSPPDQRGPVPERTPFGPSAWIALSVGRDDRAEPRWLLPLLCKAGGLDKTEIGAIRVQQDESYVELTAAALPRFLAGLGDGAELESGVRVRALDAPPDMARPPRPERSEWPARPDRASRPERVPRDDSPPPPSLQDDLAPVVAIPEAPVVVVPEGAVVPLRKQRSAAPKPAAAERPYKAKAKPPYRTARPSDAPPARRDAAQRQAASDTSKRFVPPGTTDSRGPAGKSGPAKPARPKGTAPRTESAPAKGGPGAGGKRGPDRGPDRGAGKGAARPGKPGGPPQGGKGGAGRPRSGHGGTTSPRRPKG